MPDLKINVSADLGNTVSSLEQVKRELGGVKDGAAALKTALVPVETEFDKLSRHLAFVQKNFPNLTSRINELKEKLKLLAPAQAAATAALEKNTAATVSGEKASGGFAKGLTKAYSGLRTLANIIPGIGIGGLVGLIAGPLIDALEELFTKSNKAGKALADAFNESGASVGGSVARMEALVSIARDVTLSDHDRQQALGALNKEYEIFNGRLTLANINTKIADDLINKQTASLIRQAQIKGVEDLITEETKKQVKLLTSDVTDNLSVWDKLLVALKGGGDIGAMAMGAITQGVKTTNKELAKSKGAVDIFKDALKGLLGEEAAAGGLFKDGLPKAIKAAAPEIEKAMQHVFGKMIHIKTAAEVLFDIEQMQKEMDATIGKKKLKTRAQISFEIDRSDQKSSAQQTQEEIAAQLEATLQSYKDNLLEITKNAQTDIIVGLAESLGSGENLFGGFTRALGNGLKILGAYMISMSTIIKGIKTAIKSLNPTLLLIGGFALVAIGALLSKAKIPGFAGGVKNFGGGLALVGEVGPELVRLPRGSDVIPNHQLGGIGAAEPIVFIATSYVSGNNIVTVYDRQKRTNARNG